MSAMKKLDRAEAIREVIEMRDRCDRLLDILMPEGPGQIEDGCPHPAEAIRDCSTLDDDGELYRCTKCGAESKVPFASIANE